MTCESVKMLYWRMGNKPLKNIIGIIDKWNMACTLKYYINDMFSEFDSCTLLI